jgi:hypothetical protein
MSSHERPRTIRSDNDRTFQHEKSQSKAAGPIVNVLDCVAFKSPRANLGSESINGSEHIIMASHVLQTAHGNMGACTYSGEKYAIPWVKS